MPDAPGDEMRDDFCTCDPFVSMPASNCPIHPRVVTLAATDTPAETREGVSDAENLRRAVMALTNCTHPGTGHSLAAIYGVDIARLAALSVAVQGEP